MENCVTKKHTEDGALESLPPAPVVSFELFSCG